MEKNPRNNIRKFVFWFHLVIGVISAMFFLSMACTGILLALRPQILRLSEFGRLAMVADTGLKQNSASTNEMVNKVREKHPDLDFKGLILDSDPRIPITLCDSKTCYYLHPMTGEILGQESRVAGIYRWIEKWHRNFGTKSAGKFFSHAAALVLFFSCLTGLFLWSRTAITRLKLSLKGKQREWNLHQVVGIWCLPVLLMTSLTGCVMGYAWAANFVQKIDKLSTASPKAKTISTLSPRSPGNAGSVDYHEIIKTVQELVPNWKVINLRSPHKPNDPVTVYVQEGAILGGLKPFSKIIVQSDGQVVKADLFSEQQTGQQLKNWCRFLHTGEAAGLLTQCIVLLGSGGLVLLSYTGLKLSWRRFFGRTQS